MTFMKSLKYFKFKLRT